MENLHLPKSRSHTVILLSVLFFAAFLPRLTAVGRYVTPDELIWVYRSVQFREAMLHGDWVNTLTAGHPGVVTTWLGALGVTFQMWLRPSDTAVYTWLTHLAWYAPENIPMLQNLAQFLTAGRLLVAFTNSAGLLLIYLLTRRLAGTAVALLTAFALALDPFTLGLAGLLHVDSLLATFSMISLLALANALEITSWWPETNLMSSSPTPAYRFMALAGAAAALALLSKSPALLLLPFATLFWLVHLILAVLRQQRPQKILIKGIIWLLSYGITLWLLLPALWVSPFQAAARLNEIAARHIEGTLRPIYFLGQTTFAPGPLYYPITTAFRLSPIIFLGLILAIWLIVQLWRQRNVAGNSLQRTSPLILYFGLWAVMFLAGISLAAKKFDRYALPVIAPLVLVSSLAWFAWPRRHSAMRLTAVLLSLQGLFWLFYAAYPLTAVNPLLGGPFTAPYVFDVDWGESISTAGRWLADMPQAETKTAVAGIAPSLAPFFPGQTLFPDPEAWPQADYLIITANNGRSQPAATYPVQGAVLRHTIRYTGQTRAWIYEQPQPERPSLLWQDAPVGWSFAGQVSLVATAARTDENHLHFYVRWALPAPTNGRFTVKVSLKDSAGQLWQTTETALLNEIYFYPENWQPDETPEIEYRIPLAPGMPPGSYLVELALLDEKSGAQLPVVDGSGRFQSLTYTQPLSLAPAATPIAQIDVPVPVEAEWLNGRLHFLGHDPIQPTLVNGGQITLDFYWQALGDLPPGLQLALQLGDGTRVLPFSQYDSARWRQGEVIHEKYTLTAPAEMPPGKYSLAIQPLLADGRPLPGAALNLGEIELIGMDRLFTLPAVEIPLSADFGGVMQLRGIDGLAAPAAPGETVPLKLVWQVSGLPSQLLTVFVHVLHPQGEIVAQSDQWPGGLPSDLWAEGQIIVDEHLLALPEDLPPGSYQVAVGLYITENGQRLPAFAEDGRPLVEDRLLLPVPLEVRP